MPNAIARGSKRTAKLLLFFDMTKFFCKKNVFFAFLPNIICIIQKKSVPLHPQRFFYLCRPSPDVKQEDIEGVY